MEVLLDCIEQPFPRIRTVKCMARTRDVQAEKERFRLRSISHALCAA
jgi:hypothetical protein